MAEHQRTLLWGIDNETGNISALPASPLLLPAVAAYVVIWLLELILPKRVKKKPLPDNFNKEEWKRNHKLYNLLLDKQRLGIKLTEPELMQLHHYLGRPSWAKPGEWWTY